MLLAADADGRDFRGGGLGLLESFLDGRTRRVAPGARMLFLGTRRKIGDDPVSARGFANDGAITGVDNENLGGLGAAVDAYYKGAHERAGRRMLIGIPN